jgi:putative MFS transporter
MTSQALLVTTAAGLGWLFDSVVVNLFTVSLPQLEEAFALTSATVGALSSLFLFGYALGTMIGGTVADYIGRRLSLGLSIVLYTLAAAGTGFAGSVVTLGLARFMTGLGAGTELPVGAAYVAEVVPAKQRGLWIGVMNSVFSLGIFIASLILSILGDWRWAFFSTLVLGAIVLSVRSKAEESPRFKKVQEGLSSGQLIRTRTTIGQVFSRQHRSRTIRIMIMWLGYWIAWWSWSIFVPRYLVTAVHVAPADVLSTMMKYALGAFVLQVAAGPISDAIGRKASLAVFTVLAIASVYLWTFVSGTSYGVLAGGVAFACMLAPPGILVAYTTEIFPTAIRGTAQSMTLGIARLIAVAGPSIGGYLVAQVGYNMEFRIVSVFVLVSLIAALIDTESAGRSLDAIDRDGGGVETASNLPVGQAASL